MKNILLLLLLCLLLTGNLSSSKFLEGKPRKATANHPSPCITFHFSKESPLQPGDIVRLSGTPGLDGILIINSGTLPRLRQTLCFKAKQHPETMFTLKRGCWTYKIVIDKGSPAVIRITFKNIWRCAKRETC